MKRTLVIILAVLMVAVLFVGCAKEEAPVEEAPKAEEPAKEEPAKEEAPAEEPAELSESVLDDVLATDGQPLLALGETRPISPEPEDADAHAVWEIEFAGRLGEKQPMIPSPGDGIEGKKLIFISLDEHPYWSAVTKGFATACEAYGAEYEIWNPNGDINQQNQFIDQAIAEEADMVFISCLDANAAVLNFKKCYDAGVPIMAFNSPPTDEALQYGVGFTGPDDFGQMEMLAEYAGASVEGKGGIAYLTHIPGGSAYYARYTNFAEYLAENYPDIKELDAQSPGFDAPASKQVVADWITRFGDELTMIMVSDDSAQATGAAQAIEEAGRTDIKLFAAGNSKAGMDLMKEGKITAMNYQSAEADGAVPVVLAADYFAGKDLGPNPAYYLPSKLITPENVDEFYPAQW